MRNIQTVLFVGFICFVGFSGYAQSQTGSASSYEKMVQSLTTGGSSSGLSTSDMMKEVAGQLLDTSTPAGEQISIIEAPLVVDQEVPEVNKATAEVIDTRTGRYPPRLIINFIEFPLRSLVHANGIGFGRSTEPVIPTDAVAQRIQDRLRVPQIHLVVKGRTAIVSGTVATERQRNLAESMLRFEPGIDTVENEITITP